MRAWHSELDMRLAVHGDDFTVLGSGCSLDKFREYVNTCTQVKFKARIGGAGKEATRILNRVVQDTKEGLEYEADQRHAEIVIRDMGLKADSKGVGTPGLPDLAVLAMQVPAGCDETKYRAMAARVNYLSQDRPDIQYAVKEVCRKMSQPDKEDWAKIKMLARYLKEYPRMVQKLEALDMPKDLEVWVDTDFAGCRRTRKSTSGGMVMLGSHLLKSWSTTQDAVALSSGEAEFYGIVEGATQGIGMRSLLADMGLQVGIKVMTDSSAAVGTVHRRGAGRVRHLEVRDMWVQDKIAKGEFSVHKVKGKEDVADILSKYMDEASLGMTLQWIVLARRRGRHDLNPGI